MALTDGTHVIFFRRITVITLVPFDLERPKLAMGHVPADNHPSTLFPNPPPIYIIPGPVTGTEDVQLYTQRRAIRQTSRWSEVMSAMGVMNSFRCSDGRIHVSMGLPRPIRRGGIAASPRFFGTSNMRARSIRNRTKISRAINLDARKIFTRSTTPPPLPWPKFSSDTNADAGSVCAVTNLHVGVTSIGLLSHWLFVTWAFCR